MIEMEERPQYCCVTRGSCYEKYRKHEERGEGYKEKTCSITMIGGSVGENAALRNRIRQKRNRRFWHSIQNRLHNIHEKPIGEEPERQMHPE